MERFEVSVTNRLTNRTHKVIMNADRDKWHRVKKVYQWKPWLKVTARPYK